MTCTQPSGLAQGCTGAGVLPAEVPNLLAHLAFYFTLFAVPFSRIYLPGTGERLGVMRLAQIAFVLAALTQPRVCIRKIPIALLFFGAYCLVRVAVGYFLTPGLLELWLPSTLVLLQLIVMAWFLFNVLQFEGMGERGLWALIAGAVTCASLHLLGIGTAEHSNSIEGRISVFGENANVVATTYGIALVSAMGLLMHINKLARSRYLLFPAMAIIGAGLALTGSRRGAIVVVLGLVILLLPVKPAKFQVKTAMLLLLIAAIFGGVLSRVPTIALRFEESVSGADKEPRKLMYPALWKMFLEKPVLGRGPEEYREELTWRAMPYRFGQGKVTITAHNLALLMLVETGVVGFGIFALGLFIVVKTGWHARWDCCRLVPFALIVSLVIIGLISSAPQYYGVFWVAIAYALAGSRALQRNPALEMLRSLDLDRVLPPSKKIIVIRGPCFAGILR